MNRRLPMVEVDLRTPEGNGGEADRDPRIPPPEWYAAMDGARIGAPAQTGPIYPAPIYPGNGYPNNPGEDRPGLSAFGRLAKKQALGKSSILVYNAETNARQPCAVPMLQVEGDDLDACQLCITLAPPRVIALPFADVQQDIDQQALSGEKDNAEAPTADFPGTAAPLAWPPLECVVEWGIKGASARAVVDFINGVCFSVSASYLRVTAQISQSEESGGIVGTSAAYYLAAFVGPGWAKGSNAQRTVYIDTVADATESDVFDVPKFARRVTVVGCDTTTPPNTTAGFIRFWQSSNGNSGTTNVGNFFINANQPNTFDIPAAAAYFSVYNQTGVELKMSAIFELALS